MRLLVVPLAGDRFEVEVEPTSTVLDVKASVAKQGGCPVERQRLFFCGQELHDGATCSSIVDCGVTNESTLHLVPRDLVEVVGGGAAAGRSGCGAPIRLTARPAAKGRSAV